MSKTKKLIKDYYEQTYAHDNSIDNILDKVTLTTDERYKKMKLRNQLIFACTTLIVLAICVGCAFGFGKKPAAVSASTYKDTIVTTKLNPEITFVTDELGKVKVVYGENDEGKLIIEGENFIGMTLDEAINYSIKLQTNYGYFVEGSVKANENNFEITITSENSQEVEDAIKASIKKNLDELNIKFEEKVSYVKMEKHNALVAKYLELYPTETEESIKDYTDEQLMNLISAYYLEVYSLPTKELEEMYNYYKDYEYDIRKYELVNNFVAQSIQINSFIKSKYVELYNAGYKSIEDFNKAYFDTFISEESTYVTSVKKIKELKLNILTLRNEIANLEDGILKQAKEIELSLQEMAYESALLGLETAKSSCKLALDVYSEAVKSSLDAIQKFLVSDEELTNILNANIDKINQDLNETHAKLIAKFEAEYKTSIDQAIMEAKAQKQALIESLKQR